ncbi:MAG: hypothetical protein CMD33_06965 [Flavobacteriales bacterium]|nr:hypothetical protein [Flavobacteriales bacterium]
MPSPSLSAVIIAYNEERNLARCLDSLAGVVDEVLVVDSGSTDRTVALAKERGARVLTHAFEGHIQQKNWAAEQATGSWLLSLDADEALSPELAASIGAWLASSAVKSVHGYRMNRLTSYCGQWVRHGGWYPDTKLRLWKAGQAQWAGQNPHDRLELNGAGEAGFLEGDILHYSYHSIQDHRRQIGYFSDIAAMAYDGRKWMASPAIRFLKSGFQWYKNAILRGGWRDGTTGWTIARWSAFATAEKYRKIRNRTRIERALHQKGREEVQRILVCRTDAIGDVAVALPMAGFLKSVNPGLQVDFLTRSYAAPIARAAVNVDHVVVWDDCDEVDWSVYDAAIFAFPDTTVARQLEQAGVPVRIGTRRRWPFARFVNIHNSASRKTSGRHEAWHGMDLALSMHPAPGWFRPGLRIPEDVTAWHAWGKLSANPWSTVAGEVEGGTEWIVPGRRHIILHAGSNNSATNWSLERYVACMESLLEAGCRVLWTGTAAEGKSLRKELMSHPDAVDTTGRLSLTQLLSLIAACDGLIASSTGPLHMAAGLGVSCTGLYAAEAPMWPERWHPLGARARWESTSKRTPSGHLDLDVKTVTNELLDLCGLPATK